MTRQCSVALDESFAKAMLPMSQLKRRTPASQPDILPPGPLDVLFTLIVDVHILASCCVSQHYEHFVSTPRPWLKSLGESMHKRFQRPDNSKSLSTGALVWIDTADASFSLEIEKECSAVERLTGRLSESTLRVSTMSKTDVAVLPFEISDLAFCPVGIATHPLFGGFAQWYSTNAFVAQWLEPRFFNRHIAVLSP